MWPDWKNKIEAPISEGGLRLNGFIKSSSKNGPLISYVTIVKNNSATIARTIESVLAQTYKNVEHIILDGVSTDGTLDIIKKYENQIDYYASKADSGLYDALNKAIPLCRGELILVLNSDDWLTDGSAENAIKYYHCDTVQLICGKANVVKEVGRIENVWTPQVASAGSYFSIPNLNHNAVYASRKAYELSGMYDISYKIAADSKWILKCFDMDAVFSYSDSVFVNYSLGGTSGDSSWHIEECKRVIKDRFSFLKGDEVFALNYIFYQWRNAFKYLPSGFNREVELRNLLAKYKDKVDFIYSLKNAMENIFDHDTITSYFPIINTVDVLWDNLNSKKPKDEFILKSAKSDLCRIAFDLYVLGQGIKTGVYRVCDELIKRLSVSKVLSMDFFIGERFQKESVDYLLSNQIHFYNDMLDLNQGLQDVDFYITFFDPAPQSIIKSSKSRVVHFIYDLIAIKHGEYFTDEAVRVVNGIVNSLNKETVIFAISESTKKDLCEYRKDILPEQVTVIPLAADQKFKPLHDSEKIIETKNKFGIGSSNYFISVATVEIRKNMETVIDAFNQFIITHPDSDMKLVFVGSEGWKLDRLAAKLYMMNHIREKIIFTGYVDDEDLILLYNGAVAFIYLSRYEGFGLPPLEAMSCGVPVIVSDNSSLPEVVGDAGLMYDCEDYLGVANAMSDIYSQPLLRSKLSALSLARSQDFSWEKTVNIIEDRLVMEHKKYHNSGLAKTKLQGFSKLFDRVTKYFNRGKVGSHN